MKIKLIDLTEPFTCKHCGCTTAKYKEKGPHVGRYCARCGKWDKWMPRIESTESYKVPVTEQDIDVHSLYDDDDLPWE